jgi:chaperonin GroEL
MVAKVILSSDQVRTVIKQVLNDCVSLVEHTLGPLGRPSLVASVIGKPQLVDDGKVILSNMGYKDTASEAIASLIINTIEEVNEKVGDSSTTNMILTSEVTKGCIDATTNQYVNPFKLKAGLEKGLELCQEFLNKVTKEVQPKDVYRLAYVSSNSEEIALLIADTVSKVGLNSGFIHVTESKGTTTYVEMSGGLEIESGCASPTILSTKGVKELSLDKPYILIVDQPLNNPQDIIPIMEDVSKLGGSIIIFADSFSNDVLATLTINTLRGICTGIPIQLPLYDRNEILKDISAISGNNNLIVSSVSGLTLQQCNVKNSIGVNQIAGAMIYKDKVRLITTNSKGEYDSNNNPSLVARSIELEDDLQQAIKVGNGDKIESCRKRLAAMSGGVATLYVSAPTEVALKYKREKLNDCISSITSATRKGVIPLASSTMIYMSLYLEEWIRNNSSDTFFDGYIKGVQILSDALRKPLELMVINRGEQFTSIYNQFKKQAKESMWNIGYDVVSKSFKDLLEDNKQLIDSSLALEEVLISVISLSTLLMLTKGGAVELPIEEQKIERISMM